jgi:DtxR family transcriptional regulator, Mn-dependent transcriptional regulator
MDKYEPTLLNDNIVDKFGLTSLSSNMEDYIEAIALIADEKRIVRVKDIAKKLNIKMPSVTAALNKLRKIELIEYEKYGYIELTELGNTLADKVCCRHNCLSEFFEEVLLLNKEEAEKNACRIEHHISPKACRRVSNLLNFYKSEKETDKEWIGQLHSFFDLTDESSS